MDLRTKRADLIRQAQNIVEGAKAAARDLTVDDCKRIESLLDEVKVVDEHIEEARKSSALIGKLAGAAPAPDLDGHKAGAGSWAKSVMGEMTAVAAQYGVKALLSGQVATPPAVEVVPLPEVPTRLLDLIGRELLDGTNTFSYLRQVVRDEKPAVVADFELKPTSTYTFKEIEDRARVVAHLSEPFPLRYLTDYEQMAAILDTEMRQAVLREVEHQLVAGDGTSENFTGIMLTSGVTDVPFATDVVTTIRTARTVLEDKGENPTAWVMHPTDTAKIELMRENGATGGFLMASGAMDVLFGPGVHRVSSSAVPAGKALLGDWSTVKLKVREAEHVLAATQAGDLFDKNLVKLRAEGRYGIKVGRPQALAVVHLAAA